MRSKILLISEKNKDLNILNKALDKDQFDITITSFNKNTEKRILENTYHLILADYNLIRFKADVFYELQKDQSKACLIFYGEGISAEEVPQILQKGVYTIIPRSLFSERIHDAVIGGLENRKAFIEIMKMMDELKGVNERLEREKKTLRKRNQELDFINTLSREISYDLNWDRILMRMLDAGLEKTLDYSLFGILYRIGARWNLAIHLTGDESTNKKEALRSGILDRLPSWKKDDRLEEEISLKLIFSKKRKDKPLLSDKLDQIEVLPLILAGKNLGSVFIVPGEAANNINSREILMNTLANILSLSLKNAQEYYKLREAAVTDNLTGVYNRKGLLIF